MIELAQGQGAIQSSHFFRAILDAMAKPGHPREFAADIQPPAPLLPVTAAILQTLCDFQSTLWLGEGFDTSDVSRFVKFYMGAPLASTPGSAAFAVVSAQAAIPKLAEFAQGTHEYPDRSTTLIIQIEDFTDRDVAFSGPGLKAPVSFGVKNLRADFWHQMIANNAQYPLGLDVIFVSPTAIACCPRSTKFTLKENG